VTGTVAADNFVSGGVGTPNFTSDTDLEIVTNHSVSDKTFTFTLGGSLKFPVLTVATLPLATTAGQRAFVSDSTATASGNFGAVVTGAGTNKVPVYSDGTNWRIG
jgi:hypothetical protein